MRSHIIRRFGGNEINVGDQVLLRNFEVGGNRKIKILLGENGLRGKR